MKKLLVTTAVLLGMAIMAVPAEATNGHQMIGVGAYEKAMGGAVTANPGSTASAVSNPAGLALITPRADFSFEAFMPKRKADFTGAGGSSDEGGSNMYMVPAVGWVGPVDGRDDLYFGGGMFFTSGMGVDYSTMTSAPFAAQQGDFTPWKANLYTQYQFAKMAPALAYRVSENLAVGASLNVDYQQMAYKAKYWHPNSPSNYIGADLSKPAGAMGYGFTLGAIYKVNDMVSLGATYISEQSFSKMQYRLAQGDIVYPDGRGNVFVNGDGTYDWGMNFPQQLAIGAAVTPLEGLTVSVDYKWINFKSKFDDQQQLDGQFALVSMTTNQAVGSATSMPLVFGWDDVSVLAIGVEYAVNPMLTVRAGYNHANSPIKEEDVFANMAFPAVVENHYTLGVDASLGDHWGVAATYMLAQNNEITGKNDLMGQTSGAKISLSETSFLLALTYQFGH